MPERRASRGFTLAETMLAISILAVAVLAMVQAITAGHAQSREAIRSARATALAEALAERALALPYHDPNFLAPVPGPDPGENGPADFDNVDDYDGYAEQPGELIDASGDLYDEPYQAFSRRVSAEYGSLDVDALGGQRQGLHLTVTVRNEQGRAWRIHRFIPEPTESD